MNHGRNYECLPEPLLSSDEAKSKKLTVKKNVELSLNVISTRKFNPYAQSVTGNYATPLYYSYLRV